MLTCALTLALAPFASAQPWQPDEFPVGYWCGPPAKYNTLESWQRIKDCNFTWAMAGGSGEEYSKQMLDLCGQVGLKAMVMDGRMYWQMTAGDNWRDDIAEVVKDYSSHPAMYGYFITDEPSYELFGPLGQVSQELQKQDPKHLPYINLFPTYASVQQLGTPTYADHLDKFLSITKPAVLSYDHYCLREGGSDGPDYFENLGLIREYGLRYNVPPWNIIQAMTYAPGAMRPPSDDEMRWQVYTSLAYGMKGIMYFVYWSYTDRPAEVGIVDSEGKPARLFPIVQKLNGETKAMGKTLIGLTSTAVYHTGATIPQGCTRLPGDCAVQVPADKAVVIGLLRDAAGVEYAFLANSSHSEAVEFPVTFKPHVVGVTRVSPQDGSDVPLELTAQAIALTLPPGDGALLRLTTKFAYREPAPLVKAINFQFDTPGEAEGWAMPSSLTDFAVEDSILSMTFAGEDPYVVRTSLSLAPDQYSKIRLRMKLPPCNDEGQFFFTTASSPGFADDKYLAFPVKPDGEWHEYEIPVGEHPLWKGQAVRAIRLDPTVGGAAVGSKVELDWLIGE